MGKHEFQTVGDAIAAGYQQAISNTLEIYRGYNIRVVDISGHNSYGYSFAVRALASAETIRTGHRHLGDWGQTVEVWTQDPNQLGQPGSARPMFPPNALSQALDAARRAIDAELD